ncbi:MAG: hypothetical protein ACO3SX_08770 [Vulcanococcus sp.]
MHQLWLLVPWGVFALAAGVKFWRLTQPFRRQLAEPSPEQVRASLERSWNSR